MSLDMLAMMGKSTTDLFVGVLGKVGTIEWDATILSSNNIMAIIPTIALPFNNLEPK